MNKKKKIIITIIASAIALCIIVVAAPFAVSLLFGSQDTTNLTGNTDVSLFPADYDEDIFADKSYMKKQRDVFFFYDGEGEHITDENYTTFGLSGQLFYKYFKCVINGEYEQYPSFFSESFLKTAILPEKFTQQKLYDISATLEARTIEEDGYTELYSVRYRIMDNNGTFRSDLENDTVIPVFYTVRVTKEKAEITAISVPIYK